MRKILSFSILTLLSFPSFSQKLKLPGATSQFSENLNKVIGDFKNNYYQIQGDFLTPEGQASVYRSTISLPGSVGSVIYRFPSKEDTSASWQSVIYQGNSYENAVKAYKNISRQLNKCRVIIPGYSPSGFTGKLNTPDQSILFTSSTFRLNTEDPSYAKFSAEVEIINSGFEDWEVRLNLHNKKDDTDRY